MADLTYKLQDVLSGGFEARAVGSDGARYLWHRDSGLRTDGRTGATTLLTDPSALPEAMWFPTMVGLEELEEEQGREGAPQDAGEIASPPAEVGEPGTRRESG